VKASEHHTGEGEVGGVTLGSLLKKGTRQISTQKGRGNPSVEESKRWPYLLWLTEIRIHTTGTLAKGGNLSTPTWRPRKGVLRRGRDPDGKLDGACSGEGEQGQRRDCLFKRVEG